MTQEIAESDWKRFRQLHPVALERFCQIILGEIGRVNSDSSRSFHQRYLDIYKIIEHRDKEISRLFNDLRRSSALMHIAAIHGRGLITDAELDGFSQELVHVVKSLVHDGLV